MHEDDDNMIPCERCRTLAQELTKRGKLWVCERCDPLHDNGG